MFVAYWTADREALTSICLTLAGSMEPIHISFLFASLMNSDIGPGDFAMDALIAKRFKEAA
jgi:putative oxidoreductase